MPVRSEIHRAPWEIGPREFTSRGLMFLGADGRNHQRLDFLFFFFGITFLTTFLAFLTTFLAALTTRFVTDFFFDFLAIVCPSAFGFRFLGFRLLLFSGLLRGRFLCCLLCLFGSFLRSLFLLRSFCSFRNRLGGFLNGPWGVPDNCLFGALGDCLHGGFCEFTGGTGNNIGHLIDYWFFFLVVH